MAHLRSIYQCLWDPLPNLGLDEAEDEEPHAISVTAAATDPPKVWVEAPYADYVRTAIHELNNQGVVNALQSSHIPATERPFLMYKEADVVRATILYLVHPVNLAINQIFGTTVFCVSEDQRDQSLRCDISWKYETEDGALKAIAVLELKKRGVIQREDFAPGRTNQNDLNRKIARAQSMENRTLLADAAVPLSQQAAAYSWKFNTKYVGIFDWESLFLYNFENLNRRGCHIGEWAYGTWVRDRDAVSNQLVETFRMALLGFLIEACTAKNL